MDNGLSIMDAAEDIRDQARRLAELADNGSGYSMSRSQMRVHNIALVVVQLCGQVIDEVRAGG